MSDDGYVTIHRTTNVAEGELLAEMLRREGIDARFHRVSSALIGLPTSMIAMTVDVPAGSEALARELLRDLEYVGADDTAKPAEAAGDEAPGEPPLSARKPVLAAGFAVFFPGGAHLYARRPWTTLVLALGLAFCLAFAIGAGRTVGLGFAVSIWIAIVACDAIAGVRAARAQNRGEQRSRRAQISIGVGLLGIAIVLGAGARLAMEGPSLLRAWRLAKYKISCVDRKITVENRDDRAHLVQIADMRVTGYPRFGPPARYRVGPVDPVRLNLAPGGRGVVAVEVAGGLARSCHLSGASDWPNPFESGPWYGECGFSFAFTAGDAGSADGEAIEAAGACTSSISVETAGSLRLTR